VHQPRPDLRPEALKCLVLQAFRASGRPPNSAKKVQKKRLAGVMTPGLAGVLLCCRPLIRPDDDAQFGRTVWFPPLRPGYPFRVGAGRVTAKQILTALAAMNIEWSDRVIHSELADMIRQGQLDNDQDHHPRGYALVAKEVGPP
jgi:hypothetical protein